MTASVDEWTSDPVPVRRLVRVRRRFGAWFLGPEPQSRLTIVQCVHAAAETTFTISMAGSIFFSVSADAARPRVLLYLMLALAPFLVMAPLVGPLVDRVRGGLAATMIATFVVRAGLAVLLAENLRTLLLFPLAFGMLVVGKTYSVSRNALTPSIVSDKQELVAVNARLSRSGTMVGAVAAAGAVALYSATSGVWTLRVGVVLYLVGAAAAWRVRAAAQPIEPINADAIVELARPDVSGAVWDMMVLRAAIGFAVFQFAFSLRSEGAPAWVLGAVILANGAGGFLGTVVAPLLRRRLSERSMFTVALLASAATAAICGLAFSRVTLLATMFVLGLAVSVGRRALDATIQALAPDARRGQVYASLETRLELVWVVAACLAVAIQVATWIGVLALAAFLAIVAIVHVRRRAGLNLLRTPGAIPLAERLLMRSETLAEHGFYDEAIVVARSATTVCEHSRAAADPADGDLQRRLSLPDHELESAASAAIAEARRRIDRAAREAG